MTILTEASAATPPWVLGVVVALCTIAGFIIVYLLRPFRRWLHEQRELMVDLRGYSDESRPDGSVRVGKLGIVAQLAEIASVQQTMNDLITDNRTALERQIEERQVEVLGKVEEARRLVGQAAAEASTAHQVAKETRDELQSQGELLNALADVVATELRESYEREAGLRASLQELGLEVEIPRPHNGTH